MDDFQFNWMVPTQDDVTSLQQSLSIDLTSLPPPVSDYSPMTPSFVLNKMKALASEGDTSEVAAYIDRLGPAAPEAGVQVQGAFQAAVGKGHVLTVHLLRQWHGGSMHDVMMDHQNTGTTPLLLAARNNHLALVQYLLHNGAVPDTKNCEGWAAVHLAAAAGYLDIVKQLLDFGAAHDTEAPCIQMTSVPEGCTAVPEETSLPPEDAAPTTVTPLKLAIDGGHLEVALALRNAYLSPDSVQGCAHKLIGRSMSCNLVSDNGRWSVIRGFVLYMAIFFVFCAVTVEMSVTFVIMWYLFGKMLHSAERVPNAKQILGGEPMGVFFGAILSCYVLWVLELQEQLEPGILTACFWPLNGLMALSYGYTCIVDPGKVPAGAGTEEAFLALLAEWQLTPERFCASCLWLKPRRSKHCNTCGCCVLEFDHHCPGFGTCIAQRNRRTFVTFLASIVPLQLLVLAGCLLLMIRGSRVAMDSHHGFFRTLWERWAYIATHRRPVLFVFLFQLVSVLVLGGLLVFHLYLIAKNMTTNELVNWKKYKMIDSEGTFVNARDRGKLANCVQFWCTQQVAEKDVLASIKRAELKFDLENSELQQLCRSRSEGDFDEFTLDVKEDTPPASSCRKMHRRSNSGFCALPPAMPSYRTARNIMSAAAEGVELRVSED